MAENSPSFSGEGFVERSEIAKTREKRETKPREKRQCLSPTELRSIEPQISPGYPLPSSEASALLRHQHRLQTPMHRLMRLKTNGGRRRRICSKQFSFCPIGDQDTMSPRLTGMKFRTRSPKSIYIRSVCLHLVLFLRLGWWFV